MNALEILSSQDGFIRLTIYRSHECIVNVIITILLMHQKKKIPVPLISIKGYLKENGLSFLCSIDPELPNVILPECFQEYINTDTIKSIINSSHEKRKIVEFRVNEKGEIEETNTYCYYDEWNRYVSEKFAFISNVRNSEEKSNFVDSIIYRNSLIESIVGI